MGNIWSTRKWRDPGPNEWTKEKVDELTRKIKSLYTAENDTKAHILLCGPIAAGKSAFMNSLFSICEGRPVYQSASGPGCAEPTLKCIRSHTSDMLNNCCLTDTPGIKEHGGLQIEDIIALVEGHIKPGYTFQKDEQIDKGSIFHSETPTEKEKVHCLVFVIAVTALGNFSESYSHKMRKISSVMHSKRIPIVMVLTKIDQLDVHVGANIRKIHGSTKIKMAVEEASVMFSIEEQNIFPVINLVNMKDIDIDPLATIPHLLAMRHILGYASDHLKFNSAD